MNEILDKDYEEITPDEEKIVVDKLINRLDIEFRKHDKSGIYEVTQYLFAND